MARALDSGYLAWQNMGMPIRISLYEDNTALREALELLLGGFPQFQLVGSYGHCQGVERDVLKDQPDVVLMGRAT